MYCPKCGQQNPDDSSRCAHCGTHFAGAAFKAGAVQLAQSGVIKGFFVLWGQWFVMPLRTLKLTAQQLRELGGAGTMNLNTDIPHLTWIRIAGGTLACIGIFVAVLGGVVMALNALSGIGRAPVAAITKFIGYLLGGGLSAIAIDWFIMTWMVEGLGLMIGIANNIRKLAEKP